MDIRRQVAKVCQLLYQRQLVTSVAGNVSARMGDRVLVKPSGLSLGEVGPDDIVVTSLDGRLLEGERQPSIELPMHLAIYRAHPEVGGVVHTHSPTATAFAVLGTGLSPVTTEAEMLLGEVPVIPYEAPGSDALGAAVARMVGEHRAVLLERHGVVAWGKDVREAYHRAELVEETARVHLILHLMRAGGAGEGR